MALDELERLGKKRLDLFGLEAQFRERRQQINAFTGFATQELTREAGDNLE